MQRQEYNIFRKPKGDEAGNGLAPGFWLIFTVLMSFVLTGYTQIRTEYIYYQLTQPQGASNRVYPTSDQGISKEGS
jgi:hypothetical protein